jgi:hypothetical protein
MSISGPLTVIIHTYKLMLCIFLFLSQPTATTVPNDIIIASEEFRNDSIMVTLELMTVENSVISVESQPQAQNVSNLDPRRILLTLSYDTFYSVRVIAMHPLWTK